MKKKQFDGLIRDLKKKAKSRGYVLNDEINEMLADEFDMTELDQIYDRSLYTGSRGFQQRTFERECLREYAACFPTVGGDFSFYQFPSDDMWRRIFERLPDDYAFSLKVPEDITVERFGNHPSRTTPGCRP